MKSPPETGGLGCGRARTSWVYAVSSSVILLPGRLPMIPPMTRTPIRTTRRVAESLALGAMTAMLAANSGPMPLEEVKRERFVRPVRASCVCSRLQYRRVPRPFNLGPQGGGGVPPAGDPGLTYPVTFSQCNKKSAVCYNPRREFRNCEIRQAPGTCSIFMPRRIRCPPKLCFLAAGRLSYRASRPAERTAHLTSPRLRSC